MVKINVIDSVIDFKFLKLDSAVDRGLKFPDFTYNSSSPVLADRY
jgi:hypothetical protein